VTGAAEPEQEESLEEIDNPIERLKLLAGNDEEIANYLDAIEVTSPREREMLQEIARTRPLARPDQFPQAHRNAVEALESLARHGYKGTGAGASMGPLRTVIRWFVQLIARYLVISHLRNISTQIRNLYTLREIQSIPGSEERFLLRRARRDAKRMVEALEARELAVPAFLLGGAALPLLAALGRVTGLLESPVWATVLGVAGMLIALAASWVILRGAALASRRIRLATTAAMQTLWSTVGWCGRPPKDSTRTFVIVSLTLTIGAWIIVPILVAIALAN
jgi:plasmid stabilization system protein ParE